MGKSWLLSSLSSGIVAGLILGTSTLSFLYELAPGMGLYWLPIAALLSSILGNRTQRYVLQKLLGTALAPSFQATPGWLISHMVGWATLTVGVGFITLLSWMSFQRSSSFDLIPFLTYGVIGTTVGLILGGIQLLFWRRHLRPQILWLGLSWLAWTASALLFGAAITFPYELGRAWAEGSLSAFLTFLLSSIGVAITWLVQFTILGVLLAPLSKAPEVE